jgi:hypothetical protein
MYIGAYETFDCFALELELMQPTDLFDRLSRDGVFSEKQTQQVKMRRMDVYICVCKYVNTSLYMCLYVSFYICLHTSLYTLCMYMCV